MLRLCHIIWLSVWLSAASAWATDNADVDVYLDYPAGNWGDWSWATHDLASTNYVHSHQKALRVSFGAWTAVWFHNEYGSVPANGFTNLEFWVNGGANSGQYFGISVGVNGTQQPALPITNYVSVAAGQWKQVRIPLGKLGVTNGAVLTDVFFSEIRGLSVQPLWIDDVRLTKPDPAGAASIQVDAGTVLRTVPPLSMGINTAVWDWELNSTGTVARLTEGGFSVLRYPGGSTSDQYDWALNKDKQTGGSYGPVNTTNFLKVTASAGAVPMITVNYGSGSPQEASNWVAYANNAHGGNVIYWTIGNECYGSWEYDTNSFHQDAVTYATFTKNAARAMKSADARVKVGVVGVWDETSFPQRVNVTNPRTGISTNGWSAVLLSKLAGLGVAPDFYEIHNYPVPNGRENDSALLQAGPSWGPIVGAARQMLRDYLGTAGNTVPILITENNDVPTSPGKQSTSLVDGLFLADSWAQALLAGADAFVWWDLHNGEDAAQNNSVTLYGWRNYGSYGMLANNLAPLNQRFPTFFAGKLVGKFARPGDALVAASGNTELLRSYACLASNGALRLLVVNESASNDTTAAIGIRGYVLTNTTATVMRYGKIEDFANGDLTVGNVAGISTNLSLTFPAYSLTVVTVNGLKAMTYGSWRTANFDASSSTNDAVSGPVADPNQNGLLNLLEYALNRNPQAAGPVNLPGGVIQSNIVDGLYYLTLTYTRVKAAIDIAYAVEGGGSLTNGGWTTNGIVQVDQLVDQGATERVTARDSIPIGMATNRFLRLHVSQP